MSKFKLLEPVLEEISKDENISFLIIGVDDNTERVFSSGSGNMKSILATMMVLSDEDDEATGVMLKAFCSYRNMVKEVKEDGEI